MHAKRKSAKRKAQKKRAAERRPGRGANDRVGSTFDDFLESEGLRDEVTVLAFKRIIAWQVAQAMQEQAITKTKMASLMDTSRSELDRLLDPESSALSIRTLDKAAKALGKRVVLELVDA